jgi:hypothetical protein
MMGTPVQEWTARSQKPPKWAEQEVTVMWGSAVETKCSFCDLVGEVKQFSIRMFTKTKKGNKLEDSVFTLMTLNVHEKSSDGSTTARGHACGLALWHVWLALQNGREACGKKLDSFEFVPEYLKQCLFLNPSVSESKEHV